MRNLLLVLLVLTLGCAEGEDDSGTYGAANLVPQEGSTSGVDEDDDSEPVDDDAEWGSSESSGGESTGESLPCLPQLPATVRDFDASHPDFEAGRSAHDTAIVQLFLGADGKPVYGAGAGTPTTTGKVHFDQWYRDVPAVNNTVEVLLGLDEYAPGVWQYDDQSFFPLDSYTPGLQPGAHNHHFTLEAHTSFTYRGGESFKFHGDDDLFVFIAGRLVINLGGVHEPLGGEVVLDAVAGDLGLVVGETYPLDLFFAERHTYESHFRIETTIECFLPAE